MICRSHRPDAQAEDVLNTSQQSQSDPLRQCYSIATHPRLPLLLVSDGYMVTALQIPGELNCLGLMKGLVTESTQQLKTLRDLQHLQVSYSCFTFPKWALYWVALSIQTPFWLRILMLTGKLS